VLSVVDNDVIIKLSSYDLLAELGLVIGSPVGILGTARFVVAGRLRKPGFLANAAAAESRFNAFLRGAAVIEPSNTEVELAKTIEDAAARAALPLHNGESQLCAIVALRQLEFLVTGDKAAITAAETIMPRLPSCSHLLGRFVCLEQLAAALASHLTHTTMRLRVCAERGADKTLTICYECSGASSAPFSAIGLNSYIADLRANAPTMLSSGGVWQ
jgi:hypothetical protein